MPPGKLVNSCKMGFNCKLDDNGQVSCYKARLLAKGLFQNGTDYFETFFIVVLFESLLPLVEKFVAKEWHVHHTNILTAFLNGHIDVDLILS